METNPTPTDDGDERLAGDLLVGAEAVHSFLVLARPAARPSRRLYYLRRIRPLADRQRRHRRQD